MEGKKEVVGIVIVGKGEGRLLGYPTANIVLKNSVGSGVYAGWVSFLDQKGVQFPERKPSAIYVGSNRNLLEAHILDFSEDIYGKTIAVRMLQKIRDPMRFSSVDFLKDQIDRDIQKIRSFFSEEKNEK